MPSQNDARTSVFSFDPDELFPPEKLAAAYDNAVKAVRLLLARVRELEADIASLRSTMARPATDLDVALDTLASQGQRIRELEGIIAMLRGTLDEIEQHSTDSGEMPLAELAHQALATLARGTMAKPTTDEATTYAHGLPPNAPPHGEPILKRPVGGVMLGRGAVWPSRPATTSTTVPPHGERPPDNNQ